MRWVSSGPRPSSVVPSLTYSTRNTGSTSTKASGTGTINADLFKGLYDTVTVGGVAGGSGSFGGIFTNYTAVAPQGAGLTYQLINGAQKVDGVAIFKAAP